MDEKKQQAIEQSLDLRARFASMDRAARPRLAFDEVCTLL